MLFDAFPVGPGIVEIEIQVTQKNEIWIVGPVVFIHTGEDPHHQRGKLLAAVCHVIPQKEVRVDRHELVRFGTGVAAYLETHAERRADECDEGWHFHLEFGPLWLGTSIAGLVLIQLAEVIVQLFGIRCHCFVDLVVVPAKSV